MRIRTGIVSLGMVILQFMGAGWAHAENRWALLVGVSHYDNGYDGLPYCINDVKDLQSRLEHKARFDHVVVMTSESINGEQPTSERVLAKLSALAGVIGPADTFLFYFSGHGVSLGEGKNYLATQNVDRDRLYQTAIALSSGAQSLQTRLGQIRALNKVIILDCCRSSPGKALDTLMTKSFVEGAKDIVPVHPTGNTAVLLACSEGEKAYVLEEQKHSAFTHYLIQGLDRMHGDVGVGDLISYVQERVPDAVKRVNKTWVQTPDKDLHGREIVLEHNGGGIKIDPDPFSPTVYDLGEQFSATENPNGPWSYGYFTAHPPGTMYLARRGPDPEPGLVTWNPETSPWPFIIANMTTHIVSHGRPEWWPQQVVLHPGPGDWYGNVRWTAPKTGTYQVHATFVGNNPHPTSSDVCILHNGALLFQQDVIGFGTNKTYSEFLLLKGGDTLDFAVGTGPKQDFGNDDTTLRLQITSHS